MVDNSVESIAQCLDQSLLPQYARQSELALKNIESDSGFAPNLVKIIAADQANISVRLAAALFLKNLIKRKWLKDNGEYLLPAQDVTYIKSEILNVMIVLPNNLQVQLGECISLIAESDFPHNWPNLIDDLIAKFSTTDFKTNKSILLVAHSIFKKWRPLFRSDELFLEIKMVLDKFAEPFLMLLTKIDELIDASVAAKDAPQLGIYLENLLLLVQIYYDLNCQDIPEFFEDNMMAGMKILHKYLEFDSKLITKPDEDEEIDVLIKIKTSIIELINLYITRYTDVFEPLIENFMKTIWELITSYITKQQKFDLLIVKCLQFLTSIIKISTYQKLFDNESSLSEIMSKIILPNIYLREVDLETFEDEPITYVKIDLEGSEFDSRRKSATDFLRELKEVNNELLTNIVMNYVNNFLSQNDWQNKDLAIYLFSSLAAKGSITNIGVTSTNVLVDVVKFFTDYIANDLVTEAHPMLTTDSIKYILTFRNQLTKDQLLSVVPLLIKHLTSSNPVIYTYSAITLDSLFGMTSFNDSVHKPVFTKYDIQPYINEILTSLFKLINSKSESPEKLAENDFLMKCVMRVLLTAEDLLPQNLKVLITNQLVSILKIISKNPANPKFSHYTFESVGLLVKFANESETHQLIGIIFPNLMNILSEDIHEFVPYTFQILAYLLEKLPKSGSLPDEYKNLIKPLMSPSLWQFRGNIPGITRLLIAILKYDSKTFSASAESMTPLLGIFQKLIASKVNEVYGFELLEAIFLSVPLSELHDYLKQIAILILTRLKSSRTEKFLKRFILFVFFVCAAPLNPTLNSQLTPAFIIQLFNLAQPGVFEQVCNSLIFPNLLNFHNLRDKKIVTIGLSELVNCGELSPVVKVSAVDHLAKTVANLGTLQKNNALVNGQSNTNAPLSELDLDTGSFGANFSKLVTIQHDAFDPLSQISNSDFHQIKMVVSTNLKKVDPNILAQVAGETKEILSGL